MAARFALQTDTFDRRASVLALTLAAWALGHAIQQGNGTGNPDSFLYLAVAFAAVVVAVAAPEIAWIERRAERLLIALAGLALVHQFASLAASPPGMYLRVGTMAVYLEFLSTVVVAGVLVGASVADRRAWIAPWAFAAALVVHFLLGLWMLRVSPAPHIDVWAWHNEAFRMLEAGMNPYSGTMPDIYGNPGFYAPGLVVGGRVQTGYPYPPLTLGLAILGKYFGGDYRYAHLAAMTATGALLGFARRTPLSFVGAALLLFTPRWFFVLEQGWTDVFPVFFLALVLFLSTRLPGGTPWALGFWLAVKHYLVLVIPLLPLLLRRRTPRELIRPLAVTFATAAILVVPVALLDLGGFWNSLVGLQARQPFRPDSLSFLAWWKGRGGEPVLWLGFAMLLPAYALAWWRAPRTQNGFAASVALVFLCFFAFGKQAFANYYFFVIAVICAAISLSTEPAAAAADQPPSTPLAAS